MLLVYAYVTNISSMLVMFIIIVNSMLWFVWHFHVSFIIYVNVQVIFIKCLCYYFLFVSLLCKYLYCGVAFIHICLLLTNSLGLLNSQKIAKKKVRDKSVFVLLRILVWIKQFFAFIFYVHAGVKFCVLNMCDMFLMKLE